MKRENVHVDILVTCRLNCCDCDRKIVRLIKVTEEENEQLRIPTSAVISAVKDELVSEAVQRGWKAYGVMNDVKRVKCMQCIAREIDA